MKNYKYISTLLDKYWESETSLHEEEQLTKFFSENEITEIPVKFQAFRSLFLAKAEVSKPHLNKDFDLNILTMIAEENMMQSDAKVVQINTDNQKSEVRRLRWMAGIAASVALLLAAYIFIPKTNENSVIVQETELTEEEKAEALKAYKQAKAALFFVSAKMNEGTQKAAEGMSKVKDLDKVLEELE
ncbi:MAG: hypothetical protein AB8G11_21870 [Saprospiraceae bacterium]